VPPREIFNDFLENSHVILNKDLIQHFLSRCEESADAKLFNEFVDHLEQSGYREIFEHVFAVEVDSATNFNFKTLNFVSSFQRGRNDERFAEARGQTFEERYASKFEIIRELMDREFRALLETRVIRSVVEVGSAWGATTKWVHDLCNPDLYQTYEIDRHSAERLSRTLGTIPMPVDGETLSGTSSLTMDLFVCNNVFFFMPPIKVFSYLDEADRILKRGGIALFNVFQTDEMTRENYRTHMRISFPKRTFNDTPQHLIDKVMTADRYRLLKKLKTQNVNYYAFEKVVD
jgi:hypothetical protein